MSGFQPIPQRKRRKKKKKTTECTVRKRAILAARWRSAKKEERLVRQRLARCSEPWGSYESLVMWKKECPARPNKTCQSFRSINYSGLFYSFQCFILPQMRMLSIKDVFHQIAIKQGSVWNIISHRVGTASFLIFFLFFNYKPTPQFLSSHIFPSLLDWSELSEVSWASNVFSLFLSFSCDETDWFHFLNSPLPFWLRRQHANQNVLSH